jgi:hypothetical protein
LHVMTGSRAIFRHWKLACCPIKSTSISNWIHYFPPLFQVQILYSVKWKEMWSWMTTGLKRGGSDLF